jgi:hypothetical protein
VRGTEATQPAIAVPEAESAVSSPTRHALLLTDDDETQPAERQIVSSGLGQQPAASRDEAGTEAVEQQRLADEAAAAETEMTKNVK